MKRPGSGSLLRRGLGRLGSSALEWVFDKGKRFAPIQRRIDRRYAAVLDPVATSLHPYRAEQRELQATSVT